MFGIFAALFTGVLRFLQGVFPETEVLHYAFDSTAYSAFSSLISFMTVFRTAQAYGRL